MASRPRKRKAGLMRIDAALDSLCPMGFSRDLVRKTVNKLLKAYGGDQGWPFIEEASYKVVIDAILEEQESAEVENAQPKLLEYSPIKAESVSQNHSPNAQSLQDDSPCINQSTPSYVTGQSHTSQAKLITAEVLSLAQHIHSEESMMDNSHHALEDILEHKPTAEDCLALTVADVNSPGMCLRPSMELGSSSIVKRRRPCFGWISDDEHDENDLVYLFPAPSKVQKI